MSESTGNKISLAQCHERSRQKDKRIAALQAEVERLKRYECSWTDCGAQKKNKELQAEVERYRDALTKISNWGLAAAAGDAAISWDADALSKLARAALTPTESKE